MVLIDEEGHLDERALNIALKTRSRKACKQITDKADELYDESDADLAEE